MDGKLGERGFKNQQEARSSLHDLIFNEKEAKKDDGIPCALFQSCSSKIRQLTTIKKSQFSNPLDSIRLILEDKGIDVKFEKVNTVSNVTESDQEEGNIEGLSTNSTLRRFVPLKDFNSSIEENPSSTKRLITAVQNLPHYVISSKSFIENFFSFITFQLIKRLQVFHKETLVDLDLDYQWTMISNESFVHSKSVFLKFNDVMVLYLFQNLLNEASINTKSLETMDDKDSEYVAVSIPNSVKDIIIPKIEKLFKFENHIDEFKTEINNYLQKVQKIAGNTENIYVDEYTRMYNNYKIDSKDVAHIPRDMLETVKSNLIDFRLHALKIEKERKEKRKLKDKIKAQEKLQSLLKNYDNSEDKMDVDPDIISSRKSDDVDENIEDDFEYETKRLKKSQFDEEKEFNNVLAQYKKREEMRLKTHQRYLKVFKHDVYINEHIPRAREHFFNKFVNPMKDENNSIDKNFSYYTVHANYVKFRQKKKIDEDNKDDEDRNNEKLIGESKTDIEPKQDDIGNENEKQPTLTVTELRGKMKEVVESQIVKYLGISEPSLVDFILDFVTVNTKVEKTSSSYKSFLSELRETLEEDAPTALDHIYTHLQTLI